MAIPQFEWQGLLMPARLLRDLRRWYMQIWPDADSLLGHLSGRLDHQLTHAPSLEGLLVAASVTGRVKSISSTFRKLLRDNGAPR